jgi:hypothetical protein
MRIRALCADEEVITNAAKRCWEEYFVEMDDDVAPDNVCQHLSHYGKLKTEIIDKIVAGALTNLLLENVDDDYRKHMGIWNSDTQDMRLISTEHGGKTSRKEKDEEKLIKATYSIGME